MKSYLNRYILDLGLAVWGLAAVACGPKSTTNINSCTADAAGIYSCTSFHSVKNQNPYPVTDYRGK